MFEAEHAALECARQNIEDTRAVFHWADATDLQVSEKFDVVVSNPPFHTSRAADPDIGRAFIQASASILKPNGKFWLVANRHLPYEAALSASFAEVTEIAGDASFKVFCAAKPLNTT